MCKRTDGTPTQKQLRPVSKTSLDKKGFDKTQNNDEVHNKVALTVEYKIIISSLLKIFSITTV